MDLWRQSDSSSATIFSNTRPSGFIFFTYPVARVAACLGLHWCPEGIEAGRTFHGARCVGSRGDVRLAVIGSGNVFVDPVLSPARQKLLLDTCNWLLGRDDLLNTEAKEWRYPRLELTERGGEVRFEVSDVVIRDFQTDQPRITYTADGGEHELQCDFIAGCDGFHGICRPSIPDGVLTEHEFVYPFAWLGILAEAAPATDELIYAWHERGFALYSMRSPEVSRLYIQVAADEDIGRWPDDRIWEELQARLATKTKHGPVLPSCWLTGRSVSGSDGTNGVQTGPRVIARTRTPWAASASRSAWPKVPRRRLRAHRPADGGEGT